MNARLPSLLCISMAAGFRMFAAELMVEGDALDPTTTLEVRFEKEMAAREQLGVPVKESPVVMEPALPGAFTWLSRRSGVFVPSAPPRLGTKYHVTLRAGLGETIDRTLSTPPFEMTALQTSGASQGKVSPLPEIRIAFNSEIDLASAEGKFNFIGDGKAIPGEVRFATRRDYFNLPADQLDWMARWAGAKPAVQEDANEEGGGDDADAKAEPLRDRIIVTPRELLTPGPPWRLEIDAGIASAAGGYRLGERRPVGLGTVDPFVVTSVTPESYVNSGRSVTIKFSERIAPDVDETTFTKFLRITPAVPDLKYEDGYEELTLRGKFERGVEYTLTVDPALISGQGLPITGERTWRFAFEPVKPRVYLPEFTGHQIAEGRRTFPVLSVNLSALKVTALLVDPAGAAQAVDAFKGYHREWEEIAESRERYRALPAGSVKGPVIFEKTIALPQSALDASQTTTLNWDDILGGRRTGGVLLTVEGVPMPEAVGRAPAAQSLIQLTDFGVLWKMTDEQLRLQVFSMATGAAIPGARVTLLTGEFAENANAVTDAAGEAALPKMQKTSWITIAKSEDVFATRMEPGEELPMDSFGLPIFYGGWDRDETESIQYKGIIFTDRPLYRPGEKVRVKGIVRRSETNGLAIDKDVTGRLTLYRPRENQEKTVQVKTDERGAFDTELELDSTSVGQFYLSVTMGVSRFSTWFQVAEFQPNAFEIALDVPERLAPADAVNPAVSGKYYFGAPIAGAQVKWTLQSRPMRFYRTGFDDFTFGLDERPDQKTLTLRGELELDETAKISPRLPAPENVPQQNVLTVEVTDVNQQTVSAKREFVRDASEFYLGLATGDETIVPLGQEIAGAVVAVLPSGEPVGRAVKIEAELLRIAYRTVRVVGAGGAISFSSSTEEEPVAKASGESVMPALQDGMWKTGGKETFRFKPDRAGSYRVKVTAKDSAGIAVQTSQQIFVSGNERVAWDYRHPSQIDLVPDKHGYRAGETAKVLVKTPFGGDAEVSIERGGTILRQFRVKLEGNAPAIEVPIEKSDAPNVFVSLMLIRGTEQSTRKYKMPEFRYGVCQLNVSNPDTKLTVAIQPARKEVQPGEEVLSVVKVTGADGRGVADAEVTFYAVDDGILALTGFERPDPLGIFGAPFPLSIRTGISLKNLMPEDPDDLEFGNKGYLIGGGGLEGPGPALRTNFPGTAVWLPSLRTGADGTVSARFTAPDALTRYRLVAVAHAGVERFGSGESAVAIKKPLIVLSAVGPVAHVGDRLIARAVVRNESGADGTAKVSLKLDRSAAAADAPLEQVFALKAGATQSVDIPVLIREMGEGRWIWTSKLEAGEKTFDDRLETVIKIDSPAPVLHEIYLSELADKQNDLLAGVNPQVLEGAGAMTVTLSNTRLSTLRAAAESLLTYPYGCAEQLVSGLAPWLAVADLRSVLPVALKDRADLAKTVQESIDRIMTLQTGSGGLSYWPGGGRPALFPTAWAVIVLSRAERGGGALPPGWEDLLKYVANELRGAGANPLGIGLEDQVFASYALALAGKPEAAYHEVLYRRRADLSRESRALLAMALMLGGERGKMIATLLDRRAPAPESYSWFGDPARGLAIQLMAWTNYQPKDHEVGRLVAELLQARRNGVWANTQANAWALLALSEYFARVEGRLQLVDGTMTRAGAGIPVRLTTEKLSQAWRFEFWEKAPPGPLTVANPQKRNLYGETEFIVRPPVADQPRQDRGYSVTRLYQKLAADGSLKDASGLRVGDRVLVTLRIETPVPGHFLAIDDPLPANLEAVNPEFKTQEVGGAGGLETAWRADYRETRADRVVYFCDHITAGAYTFRYLARVRSAGEVIAPATKVAEMYRPERFGLSATARLKSESAN